MGMRLGQRSEVFTPPEDHSWLASAHGVEQCKGYTLDADKFLTTFPTGLVPSGVLLGLITATGLAAPYSAAHTAGVGTDQPIGFLFTTTDLHGTDAGTAIDTPVPVLWHGRIRTAKLPTGHGVDLAGVAAMQTSGLVVIAFDTLAGLS